MSSIKKDLIFTTLFFVLLNTSDLWEGKLGYFAFFSLIILFLFSICLLIRLIYLVVNIIRQRDYKNKMLIFVIFFMTLVLGLAIYEPEGFIDYDLLFGEKVLIAYNEGAANTTATLTLFENGKFRWQTVQFGLFVTIGDYKISADTIFFDSDEFFKYACFDSSGYIHGGEHSILELYNKNDSIPKAVLCISKNTIFH